MYTIYEQTIIPVQPKDIVRLGDIVDHRIAVIEALVASAFDTTTHELDVFYKDTPAKLMCCFLLHDLLNYSIGSLATKYKVNALFLRNKINEHYIQCLQDKAFMQRVSILRGSYLDSKPLPVDLQTQTFNG